MNYLYNAIRTPDGTKLVSWDESEVSYTDTKDRKTYVISGGHEYLCRNITGFTELSIELNLFSDGVKQLVREAIHLKTDIDEFVIPTKKFHNILRSTRVYSLSHQEIISLLNKHGNLAYLDVEDDEHVVLCWTEEESDYNFEQRVNSRRNVRDNLNVELYSIRTRIINLVNTLKA